MFRDLVGRSPDCQHKFTLDLHSIVTQTRKHDEQMILSAADDDAIITPKPLAPSGFVFHESRCGSTLVANALVASNPPSHRVYSESTPPINVLNACKHVGSSHCDENKQVHLFRDVIYMMSRSNDGRENKTFFKIQSAGTKSISVFRKAFPSIPWVFVYRDPVQVMMSHLDAGNGGWQQTGGVRGGGGVPKNANCLRSKKSPTEDMYDLVEKFAGGGRKMKDLTLMEHCALHLASICESAISEQSKSSTGVMINYVDLISILISDVFPNHFKIPLNHIDEQRIKDISTKYSKARTNVKKEEWHEDSDKKDQKASQEIKDAAKMFLESGYNWLENNRGGGGRDLDDGEVDDGEVDDDEMDEGEEIEEENNGDGEV
mmetsp:Transcript_15903/g.23328  ORF Transcript_15903/g.23328 Transcript_15903/m.23328 type:complete len:374 (-) Transcript_15903:35-1156(-)